MHQTADIDKTQTALTQAAVRVLTGNADVVVNSESNVAAEIACGEDAEKTSLKVRAWHCRGNRRNKSSSRGLREIRRGLKFVGVFSDDLEVGVHAEADRRLSGNLAGPDGMRPKFRLRRDPEHHWRNLYHGFIVLRKFESGIFEGFAEIIELREVHVTVLQEVLYWREKAGMAFALWGCQNGTRTIINAARYRNQSRIFLFRNATPRPSLNAVLLFVNQLDARLLLGRCSCFCLSRNIMM